MKKRIVLRANEISSMLEIINNIEQYKENSQNGLVILLNGAWGTGKTTYLNDLKETIKESKDVELFNDYNAYEYDCYDNAYIPLFASIAEKIKLDNDKIECIAKSTAIGLSIGFIGVGKAIFNKATGIDINGIKDDIKSAVDELDINILEDFENFKNSKNYIKTKMCEVCKDSTQVFIIDELDRCKPNFAMDTLEIVKHFFDVPNCVFIIAVDKLQLEQSAKAIYGAIDSEKYFSKLFDYQFNLLPINLYDAVELKDFSYYIDLIRFATEIFNMLNISLRDGKKILNELLSKCTYWSKQQSMFMLFLFILKYTDLSFYNGILGGDYIKYREIIINDKYNDIRKYKRVLSKKINSDDTYDLLLEVLSDCLKKSLSDLGNGDRRESKIIYEKVYSVCELEEKLLMYLPERGSYKKIVDNVRDIVG